MSNDRNFFQHVTNFKKPFKFRIKPLPADKPVINLVLFLLTILSTYITFGPWYSFSVILILLSHEMGHYVMCRIHGVSATLPFFIPFPFLNPFGTLGAMIQMRGLIPDRKALFDIGATGPLAGFIVLLPVTYLGILKSDVMLSQNMGESTIILGESLLYRFISYLAIGNVPEGYDVMLHPMAYAGWVGMLVTALNLLPIGQLDGGHIFYSLLGRKSLKLMPIFIAALGVLTVIYFGWVLLFGLLLIFGRHHPPPVDDYTPLDKKRRYLAGILFIVFVISFIPAPIRI